MRDATILVPLRRPSFWAIEPPAQTIRVEVEGGGPLADQQVRRFVETVIRDGANRNLRLGEPATLVVHVRVLRDAYWTEARIRVHQPPIMVGCGETALAFRIATPDDRTLAAIVLKSPPDCRPFVEQVGQARYEVVQQFSQFIEPWPEPYAMPFQTCPPVAACGRGLDDVRRGDYALAEMDFGEAIDRLERRMHESAARRSLAAALRDRALVRGLRGAFDDAFDDLQRATTLEPSLRAFERVDAALELLDAVAWGLGVEGVANGG